jgi:hypothetical protein
VREDRTVLSWLEGSQFANWMRDELWGWPLVLTLHEFGTAVVVGLVLIIWARLVGLFETIPLASLNRLFPVVWVGFALQLLTGFALWMTKPTQYIVDLAFMLKMAFVVVGAALTVYLQGMVRQEAAGWTATGVSTRALRFVGVTLLLLCCALVTGRLTAYLGPI